MRVNIQNGGISATRHFPGVDMAKIVAMFFVVVHHVSDCALGNPLGGGGGLVIKEILHAVSYTCIDIFALTTGFVCLRATFRLSRIVSLWMTAVFWGVVMLCVTCMLQNDMANFNALPSAFLPVCHNQYWYFTMYFGLFFMMPLLNAGLKALQPKVVKNILWAGVFAFCILPLLSRSDLFCLKGGYSMAWLSFCYVLGGYIRLYNPLANISRKKILAVILFCVVVCCGKSWLQLLIGRHIPGDGFRLVDYTSPLTLGIAVCILALCLKFDSRNEQILRVLKSVAASTFGIYLIHCQPHFWSEIVVRHLSQIFPRIAAHYLLTVMVISVPSFILMSLLDNFRIRLFARVGVNRFLKWVDCKYGKIMEIL